MQERSENSLQGENDRGTDGLNDCHNCYTLSAKIRFSENSTCYNKMVPSCLKEHTVKSQGLRISTLSLISIIATVISTIVLVISIMQCSSEFQKLKVTIKHYMAGEGAFRNLEGASDYLTEQVRLFVVTGDIRYEKLYFNEVNTNRRRELAVEGLKEHYENIEAVPLISKALNLSNELMQTELRAMRLYFEGTGRMDEAAPEIKEVTLSMQDQELSPEEKVKLARKLVVSESYHAQKQGIRDCVSLSLINMEDYAHHENVANTTRFEKSFLMLNVVGVFMIFLLVFMTVFIVYLIVRPLKSYNRSISDGKSFDVRGALELRKLAESYNSVYEDNQANLNLLRHKAEHDALTNIYNRNVFDRLMDVYNPGNARFALIVFDVDFFKGINDTHGHKTGDLVLKKVADTIKSVFRKSDFPCRIGGDEFAVIMVNSDSTQEAMLNDICTRITNSLRQGDDTVPEITLSIGIAFSDNIEDGATIYECADKALYHVKKSGRNGWSFFSKKV